MNSLWEQTSTHRDFPRLERDVKTRVLIIGGGMAGVLCAHLLHQAGIPQAGRAVWRGAGRAISPGPGDGAGTVS